MELGNMNTLLGKKMRMSQTFVGDRRMPVTYLQVGPCVVTQIKNEQKDGYWAVQIGFGTKNLKNVSKAMKGHLKGAALEKTAPRFLREVRFAEQPDFKVGDTVKLSDVFALGDTVSVTSTSKGKGFAGGVKRWDFRGGPKTHGQSDRHRAPGSIGQGTTPGRVRKGKKMAGRMGTDTIHIDNLHVISIDPQTNVLGVSGPVAGSNQTMVVITKIGTGKYKDILESTQPVDETPEEVVEEAQEQETPEEAPQEEVKVEESEPAEAETTEETNNE